MLLIVFKFIFVCNAFLVLGMVTDLYIDKYKFMVCTTPVAKPARRFGHAMQNLFIHRENNQFLKFLKKLIMIMI
jgi:uncharacterized SAM-binding protein YcdF (DUF218 family)